MYVAAGDVNGDGIADIIVGAGEGGGPEVKVFNGANLNLLADFFAYDPTLRGGVRVGTVNAGGGQVNIVTAAGLGSGPEIRVFSKWDLLRA